MTMKITLQCLVSMVCTLSDVPRDLFSLVQASLLATNNMAMKYKKLAETVCGRSPVLHNNGGRPNVIYLMDKWSNGRLTTVSLLEKLSKGRLTAVSLFATQADDSGAGTTAKAKKKGVLEPKITLVGPEGDVVGITTLAEAQKLAKRRDLRLARTVDLDTKTGRAVYQLMTGAQFFEDEKQQRQSQKTSRKDVGFRGEKIISFSSKINEHDLKSKLNKILGWMAKRYEVRAAITAESENVAHAEQVYQSLVDGIKTEGRIVQKRLKGGEIRFQVLPPKQDVKTSPETTEGVGAEK